MKENSVKFDIIMLISLLANPVSNILPFVLDFYKKKLSNLPENVRQTESHRHSLVNQTHTKHWWVEYRSFVLQTKRYPAVTRRQSREALFIGILMVFSAQ